MMYLCDCTKHCKRLKEVSKSTYQRHAQFRELDFTNTYNGRPPLRPACDPSSNGTAGLDLGHDGTMAEPHEVCLSYSTSCRLAHLHVILTSTMALQALMVVMDPWLNHTKYALYSTSCGLTHLHVRTIITMELRTIITMALRSRRMAIQLRMNCRTTQPDTVAISSQKELSRTQVVWTKDRTRSQTRACPILTILTLRNSLILPGLKISRSPWNLSASSR